MNWFKYSRLIKMSSAGLSTMGLCGLAGYIAHQRYSPIVPLSSTFNSLPGSHKFNEPLANFGILNASAASGPLDFPISREVHFVRDTSELHLTLFQYQTCPFCCKVRAYLDFHGISYDVVEVNSVFRTQVKWSTYKKVPVLVVSYLAKDSMNQMSWFQMNDSSVIISCLDSFLQTGGKHKSLKEIIDLYPAFESTNPHTKKPKMDFLNKHQIMYGEEIPAQMSEARSRESKWRKWVDDDFVHLLAPNIYRSISEAFEAFNYVSEAGEWERLFPAWERTTVIYVGSFVMYFLGKVLKKRYELKDDVRASLYEGCAHWINSMKGRDFMGGDKPDLSDLAVFGVLTSIEGCSAFSDAMKKNPKMLQWYTRTKIECTQSAGSEYLKPRFA